MPDAEACRGVWAWIASVAPPLELDEIARVLGRKTIDRNAELWQELDALTEILSIAQVDCHGDFTSEELLSSSTLEHKQSSDSAAIMSGLTSARSEPTLRCVSRRTNRSIASAPEILTSLQDKITVEKIEEVRDSLLVAFGNEEDELLTDIAMMTAMLDEETDAILARRPGSAASSCRSQAEEQGNTPTTTSSDAPAKEKLRAPVATTTGQARKTSKLRQALQDARDNVHFI